MKNMLIVLLSVIIVVTILSIVFAESMSPLVTIDGKSFKTDIARTPIQKQRGLAIYNRLPMNRGMVFPFDHPDYYTFWMKDMKFPIDIIYVNQNKIVDIFSNVPAPRSENEVLPIFKPRSKATWVLEINANLSKKYQFKIGDRVKTNFSL